jgi:hypothetical protein
MNKWQNLQNDKNNCGIGNIVYRKPETFLAGGYNWWREVQIDILQKLVMYYNVNMNLYIRNPTSFTLTKRVTKLQKTKFAYCPANSG